MRRRRVLEPDLSTRDSGSKWERLNSVGNGAHASLLPRSGWTLCLLPITSSRIRTGTQGLCTQPSLRGDGLSDENSGRMSVKSGDKNQ